MTAWLALTGALPALAIIISISRFRASMDQVARSGYVLIVALLIFVALLTGAHLAQPADFFSWLFGGLILGPLFYALCKLTILRSERPRDLDGAHRDETTILPFDPEPNNGRSVSSYDLHSCRSSR